MSFSGVLKPEGTLWKTFWQRDFPFAVWRRGGAEPHHKVRFLFKRHFLQRNRRITYFSLTMMTFQSFLAGIRFTESFSFSQQQIAFWETHWRNKGGMLYELDIIEEMGFWSYWHCEFHRGKTYQGIRHRYAGFTLIVQVKPLAPMAGVRAPSSCLYAAGAGNSPEIPALFSYRGSYSNTNTTLIFLGVPCFWFNKRPAFTDVTVIKLPKAPTARVFFCTSAFPWHAAPWRCASFGRQPMGPAMIHKCFRRKTSGGIITHCACRAIRTVRTNLTLCRLHCNGAVRVQSLSSGSSSGIATSLQAPPPNFPGPQAELDVSLPVHTASAGK